MLEIEITGVSRRLTLSDVLNEGKEVLVSTLDGFVFDNGYISDKEADILANSSLLRNVEEFSLRGCNISNKCVKALAESQYLRNLKKLKLRNNNIGDEDAEVLANSPILGNLESLELCCNNISDKGGKALAESQYLRNLKKLELHNNNIGDEGAEVLANSPILGNLENLDLRCNNINDKCVKSLNSSKLPNLNKLNLAWNNMDNEALFNLLGYTLEQQERRGYTESYSSFFGNYEERLYSTDRIFSSLRALLEPNKPAIIFNHSSKKLSPVLEGLSRCDESKIYVAVINDINHFVVVYFFPKRKKILFIDALFCKIHSGDAEKIEFFFKSKGYTLYVSNKKIQRDSYSCGPIAAEIARMLHFHHKAVEDHLSNRDLGDNQVNLFDFLPREELDQLLKSFSEERVINCGQDEVKIKGADYRMAHLACALIPEQQKCLFLPGVYTSRNSTGVGGRQSKRMGEKIRSLFIGNPGNVNLFYEKYLGNKDTHGKSKSSAPNNLNLQKAPGNNGTTFWSEHKGKIVLSVVGLCMVGAIAAYVLAYPVAALALTVLAAAILMFAGIVKACEKSEGPGTEKSNVSVSIGSGEAARSF